MLTDIHTPEDAARHYDMAGLDGWIDDIAEGSAWGDVAFILKLIAFAVFGVCFGLFLAAMTSGR